MRAVRSIPPLFSAATKEPAAGRRAVGSSSLNTKRDAVMNEPESSCRAVRVPDTPLTVKAFQSGRDLVISIETPDRSVTRLVFEGLLSLDLDRVRIGDINLRPYWQP